MKIVKFPEAEKPRQMTAPEWLRWVADQIEKEYGKEVMLGAGVVTFDDVDGAGFFYGTPGEEDRTLEEIGLMEIAKAYLIHSMHEV